MNLLYPKFLKKIDHYLKINYPHVWRTRVHDFGWFSLVLGNVLAASLGVMVVGRGDFMYGGEIEVICRSFAVFLGFVILFWVMYLVRFKLKFSDFKMLLTTWLIYVFCLLSLAVNLAIFTFSMAYRTANLYSDEVLKSHRDFLSMVDDIYYTEYDFGECQSMEYDKNDYLLEIYYAQTLTNIVSLHNRYYDNKEKVCEGDIDGAIGTIKFTQQIKTFIAKPFRGENFIAFYHQLFNRHWITVILILFFLPTLLFLVSAFGVQNVLVSAFIALVVTILPAFLLNVFHVKNPGNFLLTTYMAIAFLLKIVLLIGKNKLPGWNYIAGVVMLMFGIVFFMIFLLNSDFGMLYYVPEVQNRLPLAIAILPFSLLVSFVAAWWVARQNDQPVLR